MRYMYPKTQHPRGSYEWLIHWILHNDAEARAWARQYGQVKVTKRLFALRNEYVKRLHNKLRKDGICPKM